MSHAKRELKKVKIELIDIGKTQMRNVNTRKRLEDLAKSIKSLGLIEPIILRKVEGRYEVIAGQRRFLAVSEILKYKEIDAIIYNEDINDTTATIISAAVNISILIPTTVDYYDFFTKLYNEYGSFSAVAKKTGLPSALVAKYVKFTGLPDAVKKLVDDSIVDVNTAVKARDIVMVLNPDEETIDEEMVVDLAKKMMNMSSSDRIAIKKEATRNPDKSIEEIINATTSAPKVKKITITFLEDDYDRLERYAKDVDKTLEAAAIDLLFEDPKNSHFHKEDTKDQSKKNKKR